MPSSTKNSRELLRFANFELDPATGELHCGQSVVRLQPQPLKVLMVLLRRPGELVSREALKLEVMPDAAYGDFDHAINIAISKLRVALNDSSDEPRLIETLPRRGYRFLGNVEQGDSESGQRLAEGSHVGRGLGQMHGGRWGGWVVASAAAVALTVLALLLWLTHKGPFRPRTDDAIRSLAVLPLVNLSHDPDQEYFADGMTDALITELTQATSLRVISRTSAMHYKGSNKGVPEIAKELSVDGIVEGSVMRAGGRVRINAQLINAHSDTHVWAKNYDRDLRDVLSLQSEVALAIAEAIRVQLAPDLKIRMSHSRTVQPEAYDLYLKGRYLAERYTQADLNAGIEYLRQAINKDTDFAPAYAELSRVYANSDDFFLPPSEAMPKAGEAAEKALERDNSLPEAHFAKACVDFNYPYEMNSAAKDFQRAIELAPRNSRAHYYYGYFLVNTGQFDRGIDESERGLELDPLSLEANTFLGMNLYFAGRYAQAVQQLHATVDLEPDYWLSHMLLGLTYEQQGKVPGALEELQKANQLENETPWPLAELGHLQAQLGRKREAEEILKELLQRSERGYIPAYNLATVCVGLGRKEQALTLLEKGYADHSSMMVFMNVDPELGGLHSDLRFAKLLQRTGLRQ